MKRVPRIIIAFETRSGWGRAFLRGIATFAEQFGPWDCDFVLVGPLMPADMPRINASDGLIAHINTRAAIRLIKRIKVPVVSLEIGAPAHIPNSHADPVAVGQMAADHFIERGFRRFGFCTFQRTPVSLVRGRGFADALGRAGYECDIFHLKLSKTPNKESEYRQLGRWLRRLPKPVAIFCAGDSRARVIATVCRDCGFTVPSQVAILGVDNDELVCRLCSPQLSSIDTDGQTIGFEAARLLQRLIEGKKVSSPVTVAPLRVVVRESSDIFAVEDQHVAAAIRYIRDHIAEGVNVKQLIQHLPVSRRKLELAFRKCLGRTLHEEIVLARFDRATKMLLDGHSSLTEVAQQCGMTHPSRLNHLMKEHAGMTPMQYRQAHQRKVVG